MELTVATLIMSFQRMPSSSARAIKEGSGQGDQNQDGASEIKKGIDHF